MTSSTPHEHSKNITSISMDWKEFSRRNSEAEEEFNSTTINCKHREKLRNSGIFSSSITEDKQKAEIILVELVIDAIGKGQLSCPDNTWGRWSKGKHNLYHLTCTIFYKQVFVKSLRAIKSKEQESTGFSLPAKWRYFLQGYLNQNREVSSRKTWEANQIYCCCSLLEFALKPSYHGMRETT